MPEAHYALGYTLLKKGDLDEASQHFTEEVALNPGMTLAWYHLGKINLNRGRLDEATTMFSKVLAVTPDFRPALEAQGQAFLKKKEPLKAVEVLERAVKLDPAWPDGRVLLGRAYQAAGRADDARQQFAAAQRLSNEERKRLEQKLNNSKPPVQP